MFSEISARDLGAGARFVLGLGRALRDPIGHDAAAATVRRRCERRTADFLDLVDRAVYANPRSPYRQLLAHAGCERGDLHALVAREGVEGALAVLFRSGVYLTVEEFKGRQPARRGSATVAVDLDGLRSPSAGPRLPAHTGGSGGSPSPVAYDLAAIRDRAVNVALTMGAMARAPGSKRSGDCPRARHPSSSGIACSAGRCRGGSCRWRRRRLACTRAIAGCLRCCVWPRRWRAGRCPGRNRSPSPIRCRSRAGWRRRCGAAPRRTSTGLRAPSRGCARTRSARASSSPARRSRLPEKPSPRPGWRRSAPSGRCRPSTTGRWNQAEVGRRACGCPLGALGWEVHLGAIRSFEKLTAGGMTFLDTDIVRVLEEELPARFGGGPADYQLVEADARAAAVVLAVHPRLWPLDARAVREVFLEAVGRGHGAERIMAHNWRQAGWPRVECRAPASLANGKVPHIWRPRPVEPGVPALHGSPR